MAMSIRVLLVDARTGFYKTERFGVGDFWGPCDLGLFLSGRHSSLNIGTGLLAGSVLPGSNRLIFSGFSPSWGGFYISSMGGAGLVFNNLGVDMVSLVGRSPVPSILCLNRTHGEEIQVALEPVDLPRVWGEGRGGIYSLMDHAYATFGARYQDDPRILAVGPGAAATDFGAIASVPIRNGKLTFVDTWAGRGGLGTKMLQEHGVAAVIYGGTFADEDFRNKQVVDEWFQSRYSKKLAAKDLEATTKYRFDPAFGTGGTFGVNFAGIGGRIIAFNYGSIYQGEQERLDMHGRLVKEHYLRQFNEETIAGKQQRTCGEPCVAVCKKMNNEYKKDYEPYQAMGPLCGVFDQRAAELLNHHADTLGLDAVSAGGVLAWLMECRSRGLLSREDLGVSADPVWSAEGFSVETDSMTNARLGVELLDSIVAKRGVLDLSEGARRLARHLARGRERGKEILDSFVYLGYARKGWIVPNQYWTPGVLSPVAIMGKYYMHYGADFLPPRELGRRNAERFVKELVLDNLGFCRFHRMWAEDMLPDVVGSLFGDKEGYLERVRITASRINSRNSSVFWESERCWDFVQTYLERRRDVESDKNPELAKWIDAWKRDRREAALSYWYEIHKGVHESLREF
jgi:glyceraldehyde-3-phosphate dehydrogenase (ferredoxin)